MINEDKAALGILLTLYKKVLNVPPANSDKSALLDLPIHHFFSSSSYYKKTKSLTRARAICKKKSGRRRLIYPDFRYFTPAPLGFRRLL